MSDGVVSGGGVDAPPRPAPPSTAHPRRSGSAVWRRFRRNKLAVVGLAILAVVVVAAVFAGQIARYDPTALIAGSRQPPSRQHWFGTDLLGRDLFARVLYGARVSLRVGAAATLIALLIAIPTGAVSGWYGGRFDQGLTVVTDAFLAFPYVLAAVVVAGAFGNGEWAVAVLLGALGWMPMARLCRAVVLQVKDQEFVDAARAVGSGTLSTLARHVVPHALPSVLVYATVFAGRAVLAEAALSFLGLGIREPTPAWGVLINQGREFMATAPHLLFFPASALFLTLVGLVLVGDGLVDAFDARRSPATPRRGSPGSRRR